MFFGFRVLLVLWFRVVFGFCVLEFANFHVFVGFCWIVGTTAKRS